ncbi:MAG: DUF4124 domain-containing protein [Burkholderiales bacterium]
MTMAKPQAWRQYFLKTALGRYTLSMKLIQKLLLVALAGLCLSASAQWQWIDKDGRKVFSDRAPPTDILDKNILKRPGGRTPAVAPPAEVVDAAASAPASASPSAGKPAGLDKELEAKKKQAQDAELTKRKADEERIARAKIENCARAKQAKATFDSGVRVGRTNAAGAQEIMDDATRAQEIMRIQGIMAQDCR